MENSKTVGAYVRYLKIIIGLEPKPMIFQEENHHWFQEEKHFSKKTSIFLSKKNRKSSGCFFVLLGNAAGEEQNHLSDDSHAAKRTHTEQDHHLAHDVTIRVSQSVNNGPTWRMVDHQMLCKRHGNMYTY